jgi:hypothetical protein
VSDWTDRLAPQIGSLPASQHWTDRLTAGSVLPSLAADPTEGMSTMDLALAGIGKGMTDLARGIGQKVGLVSVDDIKQARARDAALMGTTAGTAGNVAGSIAASLPVALIPGVNTLGGAALAGGAMGALAPAESLSEAAANTGLGAAGGAVGNVAGRALQSGYGLVKSTLQPFFESGRAKMVGDMLRQFAPDTSRAVQALNGGGGEIVPGSFPTAAEASGLTGLAQLEKQAKSLSPAVVRQAFDDRKAAQTAARVAALRSVAGDESKMAGAVAARDAAAEQNYGSAFAADAHRQQLERSAAQGINSMVSGTGLQAVPELPISPALQGLAKRPAFQDAMDAARNLAENQGFDLGNPLATLKGLHYTKLAIDQQLNGGSPLTALARHGSAALNGIKGDLLNEMQAISPMYTTARNVFQDMSQPINSMEVGQAIADKAIPALRDFGGNGSLRASGYAEALRHGDALAQRVLGFPSATASEVLGPTNMRTLNAVGEDLARSSNATLAAAAPGSDTVANAVSQNIIRSTLGPFGVPDAVAKNALIQTLLRPAQFAASIAEPRVIEQLGQTLLSPQMTAQALSQASARQLIPNRLAAQMLRAMSAGSSSPAIMMTTPSPQQ